MKKCLVYIMTVSAMISLSTVPVFSQDSQVPAKSDAPAAQTAVASAAPASETAEKASELSIYGEIQSVNTQASSVSVQYYDYDNDEEKTLEVIVNTDSKLENVKAISEIKKGDWADVTYTVSDGKNIAKMISVEVEEPVAENTAPADAAE